MAGVGEARIRRARDARDRPQSTAVVEPAEDDLPVEAMRYTVAEHYADSDDRVPIDDDGSSTPTSTESSIARPTRRRASRPCGSSTGTTARSCRESRIGRARARASCDR